MALEIMGEEAAMATPQDAPPTQFRSLPALCYAFLPSDRTISPLAEIVRSYIVSERPLHARACSGAYLCAWPSAMPFSLKTAACQRSPHTAQPNK
jgi:hypothetical protein